MAIPWARQTQDTGCPLGTEAARGRHLVAKVSKRPPNPQSKRQDNYGPPAVWQHGSHFFTITSRFKMGDFLKNGGDLCRCSKFIHKHPLAKELREGGPERAFDRRVNVFPLENVDVKVPPSALSLL